MNHDTTSYVYLIIYVLLWFIVCYSYYKKVKLSSGYIVIGSYFVYGVLAYILYSDHFLGYKYEELRFFPFLYLFIMQYIFLTPVFKYEKVHVLRIKRPNSNLVQLILVSYGICALVILPNILSSLQEGITLLLLDSEGGSELYKSARENYVKRSAGVSGIYGLIAVFYNAFSDVAKFFFFYYLTLSNKKKSLVLLFCIVLVIDLLHPISEGGRTDVVMNMFSMVMALMLFYPFYSNKIRKVTKSMSFALLVIVAIPFMALTISRFGESSAGTSGGLLSYTGQAPLNFNINALNAGGTRNGDRTINLFKQFVFDNIPEDVDEVRAKYQHLKMDDSIFSTYVGDFVLDYGPIGAFVIFVCLSLFLSRKVRIVNRTISFKSLLLVYFVLCVAMQGGMYLFYYSFMENLSIMAFIFTYIVLSIYPNRVSQYLVR